MKFTVSKSHRDYFHEHRYIECEKLITEKQLSVLKEAFTRNPNPSNALSGQRDLWRENSLSEKIIRQKNFAEIVNILTQANPIRLLADQMLFLDNRKQEMPDKEALQDFVCIEPVLCGLLLRISPSSDNEVAPFPTKKGSGVFFKPDLLLPFKECTESAPGLFFLIIYGEKYTRYVLNHKDPHTYQLKRLGYTYGSELKNKNHPILYP